MPTRVISAAEVSPGKLQPSCCNTAFCHGQKYLELCVERLMFISESSRALYTRLQWDPTGGSRGNRTGGRWRGTWTRCSKTRWRKMMRAVRGEGNTCPAKHFSATSLRVVAVGGLRTG